jgi:hypothetical protein
MDPAGKPGPQLPTGGRHRGPLQRAASANDTELLRRRSLREVVTDRAAPRPPRRPPPGTTLADRAANPSVTRPARDPAIQRRLGEALRHHATEGADQDERAALASDDPGCPRAPQPPPRAGGTGGDPTTAAPARCPEPPAVGGPPAAAWAAAKDGDGAAARGAGRACPTARQRWTLGVHAHPRVRRRR